MPRIHKRRKVVAESENSEGFITFTPKLPQQLLFFKELESLLENEKLCDVSFRVNQQIFRAHRVILAASSSFLGVMMLTALNESSMEIIDISPETDPRLFRLILDYIYGKAIKVPLSMLCPMLALANCYAMPLLRDQLAEYLKATTTIENCCSLFDLGDSHNCIELRNHALRIIFDFFGAVANSDTWVDLTQEQVEYILKDNDILDCDEIIIFQAAVKWIKHQALVKHVDLTNNIPEEFRTTIQSIISCIRFPLIDSISLSEIVKPHPLMEGSVQLRLLLEAFEYHALKSVNRDLTVNEKMKPRKKSCFYSDSILLEGHTDSVSAMICYGENLITGSWDSKIKVWERTVTQVRTQQSPPPIADNEIPRSIILQSPSMISDIDSVSVVGIERNSNKTPEMLGWRCIKTLNFHEGAIRSICVCNNMIISGSDDGIISAWQPRTWVLECSTTAHDGAVNAVIQIPACSFSSSCDDSNSYSSKSRENCRLVSAGDDGTIKIWNSKTWKCEITLHNAIESQSNQPIASRVGVLSLEVWNTYLFSGGDDHIVRVWSTVDWACIHILKAHEDEVWAIKVVGNGLLFTGSVDATIRVWNCKPSDQSNADSSLIEYSSSRPCTALNKFYTNQHSAQENYPIESQYTWECEQIISCDGPVYSLRFLDNRLVSAGASRRISVWSLGVTDNRNEPDSSSQAGNTAREVSWTLMKQFVTGEEGVWSLAEYKGHLISGGIDGTILFWK